MEDHAPPARITAFVFTNPCSVKTPLIRPPVVSSPRTAQFCTTEAPSARAARAMADAAKPGSARPSCGETTPPIQSCGAPGARRRASSAPMIRTGAW